MLPHIDNLSKNARIKAIRTFYLSDYDETQWPGGYRTRVHLPDDPSYTKRCCILGYAILTDHPELALNEIVRTPPAVDALGYVVNLPDEELDPAEVGEFSLFMAEFDSYWTTRAQAIAAFGLTEEDV